MSKILTIENAIKISKKLREQNKHVILAGGCFDILHPGHIAFLKKAKEKGDYLFVLLENDSSIAKTKGKERPIHTQKDRAAVLSAISGVDYVIPLPNFKSNADYDNLILNLKPTIIATTRGDQNLKHKKRQANKLKIQVLEVIKRIPNNSSSKLAKLLASDKNL